MGYLEMMLVYGLQSYKQVGAQVIAHTLGKSYLYSETTATRLAASKKNISPWLDSVEKIIPADLWIDRQSIMQIAGLDLMIKPIGYAHTAEDLVVYLPSEKVLFAGDLIFSGRIPYVGNADSLGWVKALREVAQMDINVLVAGHGKVSTQPRKDLQFVENYLLFLRTSMKQAASEMEPFEEAYKKINWSQYAHIPLFNTANRINAYNIYLALEKE
jgi:glyoxylase-like metal-dependent hydrolase (beta-lactamase superfamily II)